MFQSLVWIISICSVCLAQTESGQAALVFTADMNQQVVSETTQTGTVVYTLRASPSGGTDSVKGDESGLSNVTSSNLRFFIHGTEAFVVNEATGDVTLSQPLDRETADSIKLLVGVTDRSGASVEIPITVIVSDENDNPPTFSQASYDVSLSGAAILEEFIVNDADLVGEIIEVTCTDNVVICDQVDIVSSLSSASLFRGTVVPRKPLDLAELGTKPSFTLIANDGVHTSRAEVRIIVPGLSREESRPIYTGPLTGIVSEGDDIGTLVLTLAAEVVGGGNVSYQLVENPGDLFELDSSSGELRTARAIDRESVALNGFLSVTIRTRSRRSEQSVEQVLTIIVQDVNDEPPRFSQNEYFALIHENLPSGTPLSGLNIVATDRDSNLNAMFELELIDSSGLFVVEPTSGVGSTNVGIRLAKGPLDYENPNQHKFILLIMARESQSKERLSSTCTVIVTVQDENDNSPVFERELYALSVSEEASNETEIGIVAATDRDSGLYGQKGFRYELLFGDQRTNNTLFNVEPSTGQIRVSQCPTPGRQPCLDYEARSAYFLILRVTDDEGRGNSALVPLRIDLRDVNDNPPIFEQFVFTTSIDEGATKFDPPFKVRARDEDSISVLTYTILDGDPNKMFILDAKTGEVRVIKPIEVNSSHVATEEFNLNIQVSDGTYKDIATLKIAIRDVNNHQPTFLQAIYNVSISELLLPGSNVTQVSATDADFGENARLSYKIERASYNKFQIDPETGVIKVTQPLDFDKQNIYSLQLVAVDNGWPALTGSAAVLVNVQDKNNHPPKFVPVSQHAQATETAKLNSVIHTLSAVDRDAVPGSLRYSLVEPITAVDRDGRDVKTNTMFKNFFGVNALTGDIFVKEALDRGVAAVVTLTTLVTDTSADPPAQQQSKGLITITILDVNEHPPTFTKPRNSEELFINLLVAEEQPIGSIVGKITATDPDSPIDRYEFLPPNPFFAIDPRSGVVTNKQRLDYEASPEYNLTVVAHDAGIPSLSSTAQVKVTLININDLSPVFSSKSYEARIPEHSPAGTSVLTVSATDGDAGSFGRITYSLTGENAKYFTIDSSGIITVTDPGGLDRERSPSMTLLVAASDLALPGVRRTTIMPVEVSLEDINDNQPKFLDNTYRATVAETVPLLPPPPIVQITAIDHDAGLNSALRYSIIEGNEEGLFTLDATTGILYPALPLTNHSREYTLSVEVRDLNGTGTNFDRATVKIHVQSVNQNKPRFIVPSLSNATIRIPENSKDEDHLVLVLKAEDADPGDNATLTYHIRIGEQLVQETPEFQLNAKSGELRTRLKLDREAQASFELLLVAKDQGSSTTSYETLRLLTVMVEDENDNDPEFPVERRSKVAPYHFRIEENVRPDTAVGQVQAYDADTGQNAKIYYHILAGNEGNWFYIDRTHGFVYNRVVLDREVRHTYDLLVKATNDHQYLTTQMSEVDREKRQAMDHDPSIAQVHIDVVDINDNPPHFERETFYAGVDYSSNSDKLLLQIHASDPDFGINGSLSYFIRSSNLFHMGSNVSSGSVVPSPFHVTTDGRLFTESLMAEYNQDRFVLEVVAREEAPPFREDTANVHLWVYEPNQLSMIVVAKPLEKALMERELLGDELRNATQLLIVIDEMRHHVEDDGSLNKNKTDVYVHGVDRGGNKTIAPVSDVLRAIDLHYDVLRSFNDTAIVNVVSATAAPKKALLEPAIMALIALLVVLFVGFVMVIFTCCCIRNWDVVAATYQPESNNKSAASTVNRERMLSTLQRPSHPASLSHSPSELLNSTENPLWIEKYVKPYEEQELSMRVAPDMESPIRAGGASNSAADQANPYATIQKPRRALPSIHLGEEMGESSDYATIGGSPHNKYPTSRDTQIILASGSSTPHLMMNQNGEPILVADLI
ncbi:cadherin-87A-like [Daphnia carinata]|uniref:cadherin-87A-like n=1 Tax=Daphnia carinata TaxID=120202 RepID=UPI00257D1946|nr:cadherin-87A-like [Daphnia carinata]